jgi:hypothetical protein
MPELPCAERLRLGEAVLKAVQGAYAAHSNYHSAIRDKKDSTAESAALEDARRAESRAVAALEQHRKEHGC